MQVADAYANGLHVLPYRPLHDGAHVVVRVHDLGLEYQRRNRERDWLGNKPPCWCSEFDELVGVIVWSEPPQ